MTERTPSTEADPPSMVAQKALMKAIWSCIVDASSMNVVMSGGEVNQAVREMRAALIIEAESSLRARLAAEVRKMRDGTSRDERYDLGWDDACAAVLHLIEGEG